MENTNFHKLLTCQHCGNISHMHIVGKFEDLDVYDDDDEYGYFADGSGTTYVGLKCHACGKNNIVSYYWHPGMEDDELDIAYAFLYPTGNDLPKGLPPKISNGYINAEKIKSIDVHLYATAIRRLLEQVCKESGAKKGTLYEMLEDLSVKGDIPPKLVDVAKAIRYFGNIGAHAGDEELSTEELPLVTDLCRAILEYIYSAPYLATKAEQTLNYLKRRSSKTIQ